MNDTFVTVVGRVGSPPRSAVTKSGHTVTSFRLGSTPRRYDRGQGGWTDLETNWFTVNCWRQLAEHVTSCVGIGDPVVVHGRLRVRSFTRGDGQPATALEIEATSVGHDLARGTSMFKRAEPTRTERERAEVDTTAEDLARMVTEEAEQITAEVVVEEVPGSDTAAA